MSRPKKEFIPTSFSDLNIDSISLGSNGDRHNNNSNGARFNNLNRSKATSSFNLASQKSPQQSNNNHLSTSSFSRTSKTYGSQSNISDRSSYQSVNNFNAPTSTGVAGVDRWEQAWDDNNNNNSYRPPSYQPQQREHSVEKSNNSFKHSHQPFNRSESINQNQTTSSRSMNHYTDDPFDDPWSGIFICYSSIISLAFCTTAPNHTQYVTCRHHPSLFRRWWNTRMNQQHVCVLSTIMQLECLFILLSFAS